MSGAVRDILLDSNSYFRLGISIRPLLKGSFGKEPTSTLWVLECLDGEHASSSRLKSKFQWFDESEYLADRQAKRFNVPRKKKKEVEIAVGFILKTADTMDLNVSLEDVTALAVGHVFSMPVVTDDVGMAELARIMGIECWGVMRLLAQMCDGVRLSNDKVDEILEYWEHEKDLPMGLKALRKEFNSLFRRKCPI